MFKYYKKHETTPNTGTELLTVLPTEMMSVSSSESISQTSATKHNENSETTVSGSHLSTTEFQSTTSITEPQGTTTGSQTRYESSGFTSPASQSSSPSQVSSMIDYTKGVPPNEQTTLTSEYSEIMHNTNSPATTESDNGKYFTPSIESSSQYTSTAVSQESNSGSAVSRTSERQENTFNSLGNY